VLLETILAIEDACILVLPHADLDVVLVDVAHIINDVGAEYALPTCHDVLVVEHTVPPGTSEVMNSSLVPSPGVRVLEGFRFALCAVILIGSLYFVIIGGLGDMHHRSVSHGG
jgi:hypothetical protein